MPNDGEEVDLTGGSGGVYKKIFRAGTSGGERPPHGADVTVHYEGFLLAGHKFDSSRDREEPFTFKLGVGQVIEGWDIAVATMIPGEAAIFTCRADYAYGWEGKPPNIPVDATLRFEVELLSWAPSTKPIADMTAAEKLSHGQTKRKAGTVLLKRGKYSDAASEFGVAVESLSALTLAMSSTSSVAPATSTLEEVTGALRSCLLNHSQCCLKLEEWETAASCCTRVLVLEPENIKALFRRGVALTALVRYEEAVKDLKAACLLDPKSKEVREAYEKAKAAQAAHRQAERQAFGGMFAG